MRRLFLSLLTIMFLTSPAFAAKTLIYCAPGNPATLNPQLVSDLNAHTAFGKTVFNRLTRFKRGSTDVVPSLASRWDISKDGKTYTFYLRKDAHFHSNDYFTPTRPLNAHDVVFSVNRQLLKDHPYHKVGGGSYEYFEGLSMGKIIKLVSPVDDYTVRFELNQPLAPFLANTAVTFMVIHSKEYADKMMKAGTPDLVDTHPIGTGPFRFKKYVKDSSIRFEAHDKYFEGKTPVDKLVFLITSEASVRAQKVKKGECHIAADPAPADLPILEKDPRVRISSSPAVNVGYLAMNVQKKPFDKVEVRRAVNHALNRAAYMRAVYLGTGQVTNVPIPPTMWSFNESVTGYEYSPKKAKELLKEAGLESGFETTLWALPVSRSYNPNGKKLAELMQSDLAKVGIKAKIISYDWPTYLAKRIRGEHEMLQLGWTTDNGDPDNFLGALLSCDAVDSGQNDARWCHKPFDKLVNKAKTLTVKKERTKLYREAQEIFSEQAPWVPIANGKQYRALSPKVVGFKMDAFSMDDFYGVDLK